MQCTACSPLLTLCSRSSRANRAVSCPFVSGPQDCAALQSMGHALHCGRLDKAGHVCGAAAVLWPSCRRLEALHDLCPALRVLLSITSQPCLGCTRLLHAVTASSSSVSDSICKAGSGLLAGLTAGAHSGASRAINGLRCRPAHTHTYHSSAPASH